MIAYQEESLQCILSGQKFTDSKKKNYEKIKKEIMEEMLGLQFNQVTQEDLVALNYNENKKAINLDGDLMRAALKYGISRDDFIKFRTERDAQLAMPKLIIPALQVNMRAGEVPTDNNGNKVLKVPVNGLE